MKTETLAVFPPLTIKKTDTGWVYSEFTGMKNEVAGKTVAVVPFRRLSDGTIEILTNVQPVHAWAAQFEFDVENVDDPNGKFVTSFTGGIEEGENHRAAALRELREESGYDIPGERLSLLGWFFLGKASSTMVYVYIADVTDLPDPDQPEGDGSVFESASETLWFPITTHFQGDMPLGMAYYAIRNLYM